MKFIFHHFIQFSFSYFRAILQPTRLSLFKLSWVRVWQGIHSSFRYNKTFFRSAKWSKLHLLAYPWLAVILSQLDFSHVFVSSALFVKKHKLNYENKHTFNWLCVSPLNYVCKLTKFVLSYCFTTTVVVLESLTIVCLYNDNYNTYVQVRQIWNSVT